MYKENQYEHQNLEVDEIPSWHGMQINLLVRGAQHVLRNRLVAGEITACFGKPKSGKTFIAVQCVLAAALGLEFWGERFNSDGGTVLYVAAERMEQVAQRLVAASRLLGFAQNVFLADGRSRSGLMSEKRQRELENLVSEINPVLVVFDTYSRIIDNNEDSAGDTTRNVEVLERIVNCSTRPCAGLVIHHAGKEAARGLRGSSALLAAVTASWRVVQTNGVICLSMDDANAFDICAPQHYVIQGVELPGCGHLGDSLVVGVAQPTDAPSAARTREDLVLAVWEENPSTWYGVQEVRDILSKSGESIAESTVSRTLKSLADKGFLRTRKDGKRLVYLITEEGLGVMGSR